MRHKTCGRGTAGPFLLLMPLLIPLYLLRLLFNAAFGPKKRKRR